MFGNVALFGHWIQCLEAIHSVQTLKTVFGNVLVFDVFTVCLDIREMSGD